MIDHYLTGEPITSQESPLPRMIDHYLTGEPITTHESPLPDRRAYYLTGEPITTQESPLPHRRAHYLTVEPITLHRRKVYYTYTLSQESPLPLIRGEPTLIMSCHKLVLKYSQRYSYNKICSLLVYMLETRLSTKTT